MVRNGRPDRGLRNRMVDCLRRHLAELEMSAKEYRAIIHRNGRTYAHHYIFSKKDVNWGSYFHDVYAHEVVRWEERTIGDWQPSPMVE